MIKRAVAISIIAILFVVPQIKAENCDITKETFTYSIKGTDTLRLDKYDARHVVSPHTDSKPCIIFMFGGGFFTGARDREVYQDFFDYFANEGFVVVSIDYRLGFKNIPDGDLKLKDFIALFRHTIDIAVEDLFDATNYILDNAAEWNVNRELIMASGSSAGAVSVLQGEYERCNRTHLAQSLPEDFKYAGIISCAGAIFGNDGHLKWSDIPAPLLLFHGDADMNVPYGKIKVFKNGFYGSEYIAEKYDKNNFPYYFYIEENANHKLAITPLNENREEIMGFINRYVFEQQQLVINQVVSPMGQPNVKKNFKIKDYVRANFGG